MISKRAARQQGLTFTGHYERYYEAEKLKTIAAVIRKLYKCKAVMVGDDGGVSIYADAKYHAIYNAGKLLKEIASEVDRKQRIQERYQQEINELEQKTQRAREQLAEIRAEFPELENLTEEINVYDYMRKNNIAF